MKLRSAVLCLLSAAWAGMPPAAALVLPNGPVRILVGYAAGGAPDTIARTFAEHMRQEIGGSVIVENRPGASGKIAIDALLSSPADGQTLVLIPASAAILVPMVTRTANYDVLKSFVGVGSLGEYGFGLAAGPGLSVSDFSGLKTWAKSHPGELNFATPGEGTPQHFLGAQLKKLANVEMTHVPYKGGITAITDILGGQVPLLIATEQLLIPYQDKNQLKTLFTTSRQRNPKLPNVPTAREIGLPELEAQDWFGLFVKAGTSASQIEKWRAAAIRVVSSPAYRQSLTNLGYTTPDKQPEDFRKKLEQDKKVWSDRVMMSDFKAPS